MTPSRKIEGPSDRPPIIVTVDVALFTLKDGQLQVVLQYRKKQPFEGLPALIGGFFHVGEDKDEHAAAIRILADKAGLTAPYLEQLYTFVSGTRDPRGYSVSVTMYALVPEHVLAKQNLGKVTLFPVDDLPLCGFDHNHNINFAVERIRGKASYSTLATYLLPETFSLPELKATYEGVTGKSENESSFRRKIKNLDFLEKVEGEYRRGPQRPANTWRVREEERLTIFKRPL